MTITEAMSEVKDALEDFQRDEFYYFSKHGRADKRDIFNMKRSSRRYRNTLIQAISVIVSELESIKDV